MSSEIKKTIWAQINEIEELLQRCPRAKELLRLEPYAQADHLSNEEAAHYVLSCVHECGSQMKSWLYQWGNRLDSLRQFSDEELRCLLLANTEQEKEIGTIIFRHVCFDQFRFAIEVVKRIR